MCRLDCPLHRQQFFQHSAQIAAVEGIRAVAFGVFGIVVDFHENSVDAGGNGCPRQDGNEFGLAAADRGLISVSVRRRRQLHRMRRVENDRRDLAHDGQRAHVHDQIVVSELDAALGKKHLVVACLATLCDRVLHVPGRNELAFLDVDGAAAERGGDEQIGLAAQKCGNLQDVDDFGDARNVGRFMNVGEHRDVHFVFDFFQDAQALFEAGAAEAVDRGAVGFVVGRLEDEGHIQRTRDALDDFRHEQGMLFAFNHARARDEEEVARADADVIDLEGSCQRRLPRGTRRNHGITTCHLTMPRSFLFLCVLPIAIIFSLLSLGDGTFLRRPTRALFAVLTRFCRRRRRMS